MFSSFDARIEYAPGSYIPSVKSLRISHHPDIDAEDALSQVQFVADKIGRADYKLSRVSKYSITSVRVDLHEITAKVYDDDGMLVELFTF